MKGSIERFFNDGKTPVHFGRKITSSQAEISILHEEFFLQNGVCVGRQSSMIFPPAAGTIGQNSQSLFLTQSQS
jgi:hypothetical protein